MNTGAALQHVYDNIVGSGLDRDESQNCLVVISDENSSDDVTKPAALLRKAGVLVSSLLWFGSCKVTAV